MEEKNGGRFNKYSSPYKADNNMKITVQKKISKAELIDEYNEYQDYFKTKFNPLWRTINGMTVDQMCSPTLTDMDFVLYNILLFTTELKYHITSFYLLADKVSEYQDSKSSDIFPENHVTFLRCFNRSLEFDYALRTFVKENSLLFIRHSIIEEMKPGTVTTCVETYINNMKICAVVKDLVKRQTDVVEMIKESSNQERREFIENHYPVYRVIYTPLEWNNRKVRCLRELYEEFIRPIAPPKIG